MLLALSTVGRNLAIEEALRQLAPTASQESIRYLGRWAALLMSGDLKTVPLFRDTSREYLSQMIKKDHPELATQAAVIDLLVDLYFQRRSVR